jgi:hypothetical protein
MEERPHPPAPSPVQGEGEQETTLFDPTSRMRDGDSRGLL